MKELGPVGRHVPGTSPRSANVICRVITKEVDILKQQFRLADLGDVPSARPLPPATGPNSFVFAFIFTEKLPRRRSMPPTGNPRSATDFCCFKRPSKHEVIRYEFKATARILHLYEIECSRNCLARSIFLSLGDESNRIIQLPVITRTNQLH